MHELRESDAVADFVVEMLRAGMEVWPEFVSREPRLFDGAIARLRADRNAAFEFAMACVSVQAQALPNLLAREQAAAVEREMRRRIADGPGGEHALAVFDRYYAAWSREPSDQTPYTQFPAPLVNVAAELYPHLGLESSNTRFLDLMALADGIGRLGMGWWKQLLENNRLVRG